MNMDARNEQLRTAKADFYLTLAQTFMVPMEVATAAAMLCGDLTADLLELDRDIGYDITEEIAACQRELDAVGHPDDLLLIYSSLFIAPPRRVQINAGTYLDGSFNGGSVVELETCYALGGAARAEQFRDLADHVALQLEFVAHLYSGIGLAPTPGQFIDRYPARWIDPMIDDIERANAELGLAANPYLWLARILRKALAVDAEREIRPLTASERRERALALARHKEAERGISAADYEEMRRRLAERGLSTEHLAADRNAADDPLAGWKPMTPPAPRPR
jgi:TorA maturation chaperone TorD